jgi:hypothetical protein
VIKSIDVIRDIAQAGSATVPPVVSEDVARSVTRWHEAALDVIHQSPSGWQPTVRASLTVLRDNLPAREKGQLSPYISLALAVLGEVQ